MMALCRDTVGLTAFEKKRSLPKHTMHCGAVSQSMMRKPGNQMHGQVSAVAVWHCHRACCGGAQMTEEARLRLVAGLKRYFHGKRAEGLLSARGMQLLDWACALQMDQAGRPLFLVQHIERCVSSSLARS